MTFRALARLLVVYLTILTIACVGVRRWVALRDVTGETIVSAWQGGVMTPRGADGKPTGARLPSTQIIEEHVVAEGPLVSVADAVLALSLVPGRDGVKATIAGKTVYVTPDELLARQAYDRGFSIPSLSLTLGANVPLIEGLLADGLGVSVRELRTRATFRRVRTRRAGAVPQPFAAISPAALTPDLLRGAALDAARFLARGVTAEGRFRYMIDAPANESLPGYDWPRHAGATYFLAQAAALSPDPLLRGAALRTANYLRDHAMVDCGPYTCIGQGNVIDVGSAALGLIAMSEIARTGIDPSYRTQVNALAGFLRSQQRADGEFKHQFDRSVQKPRDVQFLYYSGEATLALARAWSLTHDPANRDAAARGLAHLVGPAWHFFGARYYFGEEHWTCQALNALWSDAPDLTALSFCERWQAYGRTMLFGPGDTAYDCDGAYGVDPIIAPRYTPVASRCEAGVATLDVMARAHRDPEQRAALAAQLRRSLALLLRQQFRPGLSHLFADPAAVYGAIPGSAVDWQLRIDYAQHAGSALISAATSELFAAP